MAPLPELVGHPEDELGRPGPGLGQANLGEVVRVDEARIPVALHLARPSADGRDDGVAHVPAAVLAEHEHQVGRRRDDAAEVGSATAGGRDEREREEERDREARDPKRDLDDDQLPEALVRVGPDRPRGVQRHVGREVGEDPKPGDRICRVDVLVRRLADGDGTSREDGASRGGQVADQPLLLLELSAHDRVGRARDLGVVVVTVYRRRQTAVEERVRALPEDGGRRARIGGGPGTDEQHLLHVALGQRPLAGRDLEHGRPVLRSGCGPDRQADRDRRRERERRQDRGDRAAARACKRRERSSPSHAYSTVNRRTCRRGSGPPCCRRPHSARAGGAGRARGRFQERRARASRGSPARGRLRRRWRRRT